MDKFKKFLKRNSSVIFVVLFIIVVVVMFEIYRQPIQISFPSN